MINTVTANNCFFVLKISFETKNGTKNLRTELKNSERNQKKKPKKNLQVKKIVIKVICTQILEQKPYFVNLFHKKLDNFHLLKDIETQRMY